MLLIYFTAEHSGECCSNAFVAASYYRLNSLTFAISASTTSGESIKILGSGVQLPLKFGQSEYFVTFSETTEVGPATV